MVLPLPSLTVAAPALSYSHALSVRTLERKAMRLDAIR